MAEIADPTDQSVLTRLSSHRAPFSSNEIAVIVELCRDGAVALERLAAELNSLLSNGIEGSCLNIVINSLLQLVQPKLETIYPKVAGLIQDNCAADEHGQLFSKELTQMTQRAEEIRLEALKLKQMLESPLPPFDLTSVVRPRTASLQYEGYVDVKQILEDEMSWR